MWFYENNKIYCSSEKSNNPVNQNRWITKLHDHLIMKAQKWKPLSYKSNKIYLMFSFVKVKKINIKIIIILLWYLKGILLLLVLDDEY